MNLICASEAGGPVRVSHLAGANPIPESVWSRERDAFVLIRKAMGAHAVQKLHLGEAIC